MRPRPTHKAIGEAHIEDSSSFQETDMQASRTDIINLEKKFWQSMVDQDTDLSLSMLNEPSLMVSSHGTMQFDHRQFRQMAEQGSMAIKSFELSDMNVVFPTDDSAVLTYKVKQSLTERVSSRQIDQEMADSSVWMCKNGQWLCVMHTETPIEAAKH
jgi:hypothetical protein